MLLSMLELWKKVLVLPLLYDLVGVTKLLDEFIKCAEYIMKQRHLHKITFSVVLAYLKKHTPFNYKAVRIRPLPLKHKTTNIQFPSNKVVLDKADKIQICFFDKTLLTKPFEIVDKKVITENQTI